MSFPPTEHRNMPQADAMVLVARNYERYKNECREKEREAEEKRREKEEERRRKEEERRQAAYEKEVARRRAKIESQVISAGGQLLKRGLMNTLFGGKRK